MLRAFALLSALAFGAAQPDPGLIGLQREDQRVADIAYRLQARNVALCRDQVPLLGFVLHGRGQYVLSAREAAAASFGFAPERASVLAVAASSPAARANLMPNDRVVRANGISFKLTELADASDVEVSAMERTIASFLKKGHVDLQIVRSGRVMEVRIVPELGCASRIQLVPGGKLGASADGETVQLTTATLNLATDDDGLALIIAHELAHNIRRHGEQLDAQKVNRGLLAPFGKNRRRIRATEIEADYWSVYLIANAGYDLDRAAAFMARFAKKIDLGPLNDGTHLGVKARNALIAATIAEVRAKQRARQPLIPNAAPPTV
jgi:DNA-binding MarR family transcriptional regulator